MSKIVEHVWPIIVGDKHCGQTAKIVTIDRNDLGAAIRATLEYVRDNIPASVAEVGGDEGNNHTPDGLFGHSHAGYQDGAAADIFRAMTDALLAELDGPESEGRG